jgi:hypothetical protein
MPPRSCLRCFLDRERTLRVIAYGGRIFDPPVDGGSLVFFSFQILMPSHC